MKPRPPSGSALAVFDIGSNSARVVVFRARPPGALEVIANERASLRLVREIGKDGNLSAAGTERILSALRDFRTVARGAGAKRVIAVATAALRDSGNGERILARIRRVAGVRVRVLDGAREGRYAFLGAVHGLPVHRGAVIDLGGGSLEIVLFRRRRLRRVWSLPLGALRLSDEFLASDPPAAKERRFLAEHVAEVLEDAGLRPFREGDLLVGTGGTIRNLAEIDARRRAYPIATLHGYALPRRRLKKTLSLVASKRRSAREAVPGLHRDRADSIVGGALAVDAVMRFLGADRVMVSGQGLREGLVLEALGARTGDPHAVRRASVFALASRFSSWNEASAERRAAIASRLLERLVHRASGNLPETLAHAARLLDIGSSIDYFDRAAHSARIVRSTDLPGFTHGDIAALSAMLEFAGTLKPDFARFRGLLDGADRGRIERAGVLLALADGIELRLPPGSGARAALRIGPGRVVIASTAGAEWMTAKLAKAFRHAFGRALEARAPERKAG